MESNLQNKLQEFSSTPPEGVWNKIADALDTENNFSQRLYQYEEQPPVAVWATVEKNLEEPAPAKIVPFTTRFRRPLRYAAVACFLVVALTTITLTVKRTEAGAIDAGSNTTVPMGQTPTGNTASAEQPKNTPQHAQAEGQNDNNIEKKETARSAQSGTTEPQQRQQETGTAANNTTGNNKKLTPVYSSLNEYVVFNDGDGRLRKVSKKMADFINCKDDDARCKQRLQQLRQKMAAKAMTSDFTGILEMLRQLQ